MNKGNGLEPDEANGLLVAQRILHLAAQGLELSPGGLNLDLVSHDGETYLLRAHGGWLVRGSEEEALALEDNLRAFVDQAEAEDLLDDLEEVVDQIRGSVSRVEDRLDELRWRRVLPGSCQQCSWQPETLYGLLP